MAAQFVTPEAINFMAVHGRGLICLALSPERCDQLHLPLVSPMNTSRFGTAFCESIDAAEGVTTGISAADRAHTIHVAMRPGTKPSDLARPGHVFPSARARRRRAGPRRTDRSGCRSGSHGWPRARRRHLRNHERGRQHGARPGAHPVLRAPRTQDDLGRQPDPLSPSDRESDPAARRRLSRDRVRQLQDRHLRQHRERRGASGAGSRRGSRQRQRPGADAFPLRAGRCVRIHRVQLRRDAARFAQADHRGGRGRAGLSASIRMGRAQAHSHARRISAALCTNSASARRFWPIWACRRSAS